MYVVEIQPNPSREELRWAWKFTVVSRARGHCEGCGKAARLDACHRESREARPDLEFDADNGIALCRSCHMKFDHANGHRPSGRPVGMPHTAETKQKIGAANKRAHGTPEARAAQSERALRQWDRQGRKTAPRPCENCGTLITGHKQHAGNRFCSPTCHYAFRTGKPRSSY